MGRDGQVATFKIIGVGTFKSAVGFKAAYSELISDGVSDFIIDLGECDILDSTFLGIILGLALKVRQLGSGHVHIIRPNEMIRNLFRGTGLDQILDMSDPRGA
jgi:anti-anti-sigma factor